MTLKYKYTVRSTEYRDIYRNCPTDLTLNITESVSAIVVVGAGGVGAVTTSETSDRAATFSSAVEATPGSLSVGQAPQGRRGW